jgi:hypothetical protein
MADIFETPQATDSHSYFVPMVDMLAGVVFILIIMLASVSLVSRADFSMAANNQAEIKRIQAELEKARLLEARYLDPRRTAETALRLLLSRLHDGLAHRGFESESKPDEGRLIVISDIESDPLLTPPQGVVRIADVLAEVLGAELPCLADGAQPVPNPCAAYPVARLDTVAIAVRRPPGNDSVNVTPATGEALSLFAEVARAAPNLLALRAPGGASLITYRGLSPLEGTSDEHHKPSTGRIELQMQMEVPPLPR